METVVIFNKKGFTLIEFLVAIVIMMVGLLGLLQTVNYAMSHNMNNQLRQEAVMVADELMQIEMAKPFENIVIGTENKSPQRIVNGNPYSYAVVITNSSPTARTININLNVSWTYKQVQYEHAISSLVSQYE
ncbi:MAG: type IV pilus modification PilV family protein [Desulfuromonadaceae bacterium]